ncbi:unnamed protein product [Phaeothamnion confervicola]
MTYASPELLQRIKSQERRLHELESANAHLEEERRYDKAQIETLRMAVFEGATRAAEIIEQASTTFFFFPKFSPFFFSTLSHCVCVIRFPLSLGPEAAAGAFSALYQCRRVNASVHDTIPRKGRSCLSFSFVDFYGDVCQLL